MRWSKMSLWNKAYYAADRSHDLLFTSVALLVLSHFTSLLWYVALGALLLSFGYYLGGAYFARRAEQEQAAVITYGDGWHEVPDAWKEKK